MFFYLRDLVVFAHSVWTAVFPTVRKGSAVSRHRRTSQVFLSRGCTAQSMEDWAAQHGGQRQEERQPAVWPQHAGRVPGQLQVRTRAERAWERCREWATSRRRCPQWRCWRSLVGSAAAALRSADWSRNVLLSLRVCIWACLLPEDRAEPCAPRSHYNHISLSMSHRPLFWWSVFN